MPFVPHEWFMDLAAKDGGWGGLDADGLPRHGSNFWDGVPPARLGGNGNGSGSGSGSGEDCERDATVYRRFVNGPHRFVWLATMYDEATDTAYGCYDLNYDDGGRWGPIPMAHVRMLGGRVDASWRRPLPYADAILHRARVSAPYTEVRRTPPRVLVGFDACPSDDDDRSWSWPAPDGGRHCHVPRRTIEIPRRLRPCGIDSETGAPMYEYCYGRVPQDGAPVILDTIYQSGDAGALALARRLNGSYGYAIRVCRNAGGCSLCWDRPCRDGRQRMSRRNTAAGRTLQNGGGRQ